MKILFLFIACIHISTCYLLIYQDKNANIQKYLDYFQNIDDLIVLKHTFDKEDLYKIEEKYDIRGYIYPGGNSNITDRTTPYWKYISLTINNTKPIMAICAGFQHYLKALSSKILLSRCYMYDMHFKDQIHNHKWCIKKKFNKFIPDDYILHYYTYVDEEYIESFENNKTLGLIYHPEKVSCEDSWKYILLSAKNLNKFQKKLPRRNYKKKSTYENINMYKYPNKKNKF